MARRAGPTRPRCPSRRRSARPASREELPVADLERAAGPPAQEAEPEAAARGRRRVPQEEGLREAVKLGGALVVVPHEQLGRLHAAARAVTEVGGQRRLEVQGEQVRLTPGGEMGLVTDSVELVVGAQRRPPLAVADPSLLLEGGETASAEQRVSHPQHDVEVPQAARALLDVGLLEPYRASEPLVV